MKLAMIVALALVTACAAFPRPTLEHAHKAALVESELVLACDYGQTSWLSDGGRWDRPAYPELVGAWPGPAAGPPRGGYWFETNPILGKHPSDLETGVYLGAIGAVAIAAYPYLPSWARSAVYFTLAAVETANVLTNNHHGFCGI